MKVREVLDKFEFAQIEENEFIRDIWTVRLEGNKFELFADPEIDTRYYFGYVDNLEKYLNVIT